MRLACLSNPTPRLDVRSRLDVRPSAGKRTPAGGDRPAAWAPKKVARDVMHVTFQLDQTGIESVAISLWEPSDGRNCACTDTSAAAQSLTCLQSGRASYFVSSLPESAAGRSPYGRGKAELG
jgi:hypothetical protein